MDHAIFTAIGSTTDVSISICCSASSPCWRHSRAHGYWEGIGNAHRRSFAARDGWQLLKGVIYAPHSPYVWRPGDGLIRGLGVPLPGLGDSCCLCDRGPNLWASQPGQANCQSELKDGYGQATQGTSWLQCRSAIWTNATDWMSASAMRDWDGATCTECNYMSNWRGWWPH